jgi:glycosyltransferase involved in cell wall biosynthesis
MKRQVKGQRETNSNERKKTTKMHIKVLYVCPYAHYPGHFAAAAVQETQALSEAGVDVMLLTFCGVIGKAEITVPCPVAFPQTSLTKPIHNFIRMLRKWTISRWLVMFFETLVTLSRAISVKRKKDVDIIHLRDGEPFLFLSHLLSLPYRGYRWVVSLTASNIYPPKPKTFTQFIYTIAVRFVNSGIWKPLYRASLTRNGFIFLTQNETARRDYNSYLGGIFSGKVIYLPLGSDKAVKTIDKDNARKRLKLPPDKPIFLSFGAPHSGKDLETIFRAVGGLPDVCLVHAGSQAFSLGANPSNQADKYSEPNKVIISNHYISEEEKPYYFFASDAAILSYTRQFLSTSSLLWEACRFGTPVIASDNGQLRELVEAYDVGLLFRAQNSDSLMEAMVHFIKLNPEQIELLKRSCRRFANEFSLEKWAQRCIEIYDSLLKLATNGNSPGPESASDGS